MKNLLCVTMIMAVVLLVSGNAYAISGSDVLSALDNPRGVEFLYFEYCVQKMDKEGFAVFDDITGEPVYSTSPKASSSSDKWTVQKSLDAMTKPQTGSCLRSKNTANLSSARIYLRVYGPGTFALRYKTSTEYGDCLNIYVDQENVVSGEGYDTDYVPGQATSPADESEWMTATFQVPGGVAEKGSQAGTYYHEILIEYAKDEYEPDGPVKPNKKDYDGDTEWYNEDLAAYNEAKPYYNDCVWIDAGFFPLEEDENYVVTKWGTVWQQDDVTLNVDLGTDVTFVDSYEVLVDTNAYDFGYVVRYTLNGKMPSGASEQIQEREAVKLTETCTMTTAVFSGSVKVPTVQPVTLNFTRKGATPVISFLADQSGENGQAYSVTTTTQDGVIWYRIGEEAPWSRLDSQPLMVNTAGILYAKTVPANEAAIESDVASVTIQMAEPPVISAMCGDRPFTSGEMIDENESVQFKHEPKAGTVVRYSINSGDWAEMPLAGFLVAEKAVVRFKAQTDAGGFSSVIEYVVNKATTTFRFSGDSALRNGWNLISFPIYLTSANIREFLALTDGFFTLDNGTSLISANSIEPEKAYFCHFSATATAAGDMEFHGMETETAPELKPGWNLVGVADECQMENAWSWNGKRFVYTEKLVPGKGYFILKIR
ncbi:MAG: hypothetical protein J6X55_11735 [Victivallales bacterium]|nr:hypothetical protein [Victivallales bacterium]